MPKAADLFTVTENFIGDLDGSSVEYYKGEVVDGEDRALRKWPQHFAPLVISHRAERRVEQATAAPGEKRG